MTNDCVFLPRAAKRKAAVAAAEATKVLTGLNTQPGKLIIDATSTSTIVDSAISLLKR